MTRKEYYSLREDIGIIDNISKLINYINEILDIYPNLNNCTLQEVKEWLIERHTHKSLILESRLIDGNKKADEQLKKEFEEFIDTINKYTT